MVSYHFVFFAPRTYVHREFDGDCAPDLRIVSNCLHGMSEAPTTRLLTSMDSRIAIYLIGRVLGIQDLCGKRLRTKPSKVLRDSLYFSARLTWSESRDSGA